MPETLPGASQVRIAVDFADKLTNSIEMRPRVWSKHTVQKAPKMHGRAAKCAKKRPGSARTASCARDRSRPGLDAVAWCRCMYATAGCRDGDVIRSPAQHEVSAIAQIHCLAHFRRPLGKHTCTENVLSDGHAPSKFQIGWSNTRRRAIRSR